MQNMVSEYLILHNYDNLTSLKRKTKHLNKVIAKMLKYAVLTYFSAAELIYNAKWS